MDTFIRNFYRNLYAKEVTKSFSFCTVTIKIQPVQLCNTQLPYLLTYVVQEDCLRYLATELVARKR